MARVRGGSTGFAVALVIFGCGFVIALLVAVIFYTKIETHKAMQVAAEEELRKYVSAAETGPANDYVSSNATVFGNMAAKIVEVEDELRKSTETVAELTAKASNQEASYKTLDTEKSEIEARLGAERDQYNQIMAERQSKIDNLLRQKEDLTSQIAGLQAKVTSSIGDADAAARERIEQLNQQVAELGASISDLEKESRDWRVKYQQLLAIQPKYPEPNTTLPDAQVASVFGNGRNLFISLGRNDGLVMGMTFEVYAPDPILRLNTVGEARGKASIEVYGLDDNSATCRIVRLERGASVDPGDPVVNVGYDPNMPIDMVAFGYFDIDGDGGTNDIGRINALVESTTANVAVLSNDDQGNPVLTPDIDYIILGKKPVLPDPPSDNEFDPEVLARYQKALAANEAYFQIVDNAKLMGIPILNQNRFLHLIGYYER